jgi:excisionase family DNA binding protein
MSRHKGSIVPTPPASDTECLRTHEIARVLGVSQIHVLRLMRKKILPGFRLGRVWLVRRVDLENYLRSLMSGSSDSPLKNP